MKCSECAFLDLSTKVSRRWAAHGEAVCAKGLTPADCGSPTISMWRIDFAHSCPAGVRLDKAERIKQSEKLAFLTDYLLRKMGKR